MCQEGAWLESLACHMTGPKREDLSEGHNHHHNIGTSCLFRVKTITLNNSTILSESDSQTDRQSAETFIRQGTMTLSFPTGFSSSSGIEWFDLIVGTKDRLPPGSASDS